MREYQEVLAELSHLIHSARLTAARRVNTTMTTLYWWLGFRIVEFEQQGSDRAEYGNRLMKRLSVDLAARFGRGFSDTNLRLMRAFYLAWQRPNKHGDSSQSIEKTSGYTIQQALPAEFRQLPEGLAFPLPWTSYVMLLAVKELEARQFYEREAVRGGWSTRQLKRQIQAQFFERTALSRNKNEVLKKTEKSSTDLTEAIGSAIRDPFILEFLGLKDEYSESDLEEALIQNFESFLLELGGEYCFVGRQKRLRIGNSWYRVDLIFFHRVLRCLVVIDLKIGAFSHADVGQMHMYLNYAKEHWMHLEESPPVGLILCASKDADVAHYALDGLPNKVLAREYQMALPKEEELIAEIERVRAELDNRL
jgi:predicted nuclease of restriction endonuclease-like (RecB) superfamily